jgi:hypothetical protein
MRYYFLGFPRYMLPRSCPSVILECKLPQSEKDAKTDHLHFAKICYFPLLLSGVLQMLNVEDGIIYLLPLLS